MSAWKLAVKRLGELGGKATKRQLEWDGAESQLQVAKAHGLALVVGGPAQGPGSIWGLTDLGRSFVAGETVETLCQTGGRPMVVIEMADYEVRRVQVTKDGRVVGDVLKADINQEIDMSKNSDAGKWAEAQAQKWLEAKSQADHGFAYHRYPDARAARGALANQPSDFLVAQRCENVGCVPAHLEVKETKQVHRLPKAKISQYGKLKLFHGAGFSTYVLIYRSEVKDWVILLGGDLFEYDEVPPSFPLHNLESFPTADAALERIFG